MKKENVVIKQSIIPELVSGSSTQVVEKQQALKTLKRVQGLSRFITTRGFTLIELLVVVLIIGLLAAMAVPQYQKAVLKSRFATIKDLTRSIAQAEEVYYLANGHYTPNTDELDVDIPTPIDSKLTETKASVYFYPQGYCVIDIQDNKDVTYCILSNEKNVTETSLSNRIMAYHIHLNHGQMSCYAYGSDLNSPQDKICQSETGKENATDSRDTLRKYLY